jgi:hypothetical protein
VAADEMSSSQDRQAGLALAQRAGSRIALESFFNCQPPHLFSRELSLVGI